MFEEPVFLYHCDISVLIRDWIWFNNRKGDTRTSDDDSLNQDQGRYELGMSRPLRIMPAQRLQFSPRWQANIVSLFDLLIRQRICDLGPILINLRALYLPDLIKTLAVERTQHRTKSLISS